MSSRMRNSIWAAAAFLSPLAAQADCQATGCYHVYVEQLMMTSTNGFWIRTSGNETLANCTPDSSVLLHVPASNVRFKELYATLLAAQLADKFVSIVIDGGSNPCTVNYMYLDRQ